MRIKGTSRVQNSQIGPAPLGDKGRAGDFNQSFHRQMSDVNSAEYDRYLRELADNIHRQGEMVSQRMDLAEFQKYRELISELLRETASNSFAYYKTDKFDARGRHKIFAVIRRVNQRLEDMAKQILAEEKDNITVLGIVDDIKGMLVDLLM